MDDRLQSTLYPPTGFSSFTKVVTSLFSPNSFFPFNYLIKSDNQVLP